MSTSHFAPENRRRLYLRPGREKSVRNRHPWVFDGAIANEDGPANAAIGDLVTSDGRHIASGFYSLPSQIRLRAIAFDEELTAELLRDRIAGAVRARASIFDGETNAARLINAEGDRLSGIVADLYDDTLVVEITCAGIEKIRDLVVDALLEAARVIQPVRRVLMKNDLPHRKIEGLSTKDEWLEGGMGESDEVVIGENGRRFVVQPGRGQKTGFFLDQRENRAIAGRLALGARVLNVFSYTGGFGVYAASGGAIHVEEIDASAPAIELAQRNHELNPFECDITGVAGDAFEYLRELGSEGRTFELIIVDPPAFTKTKRDVDRAARGYKDINMQALKLLAPGGHLLTFSCSGHISSDLFQKIVFSAAADAAVDASIIARLGAGPDHPVSLFCPEGEYLKGLILRRSA